MAKAKRSKKPAAKRRRKILTATARIKAAAKKSAARIAKGARIVRRAAKSVAKKRAKKAADKFVLHGFFASVPSCKVGLMLTMCGVAWDYRHVDLMNNRQQTSEFRLMNRFAQVPVLEHAGHMICQSDTILLYLAQATGKFGGRSEQERLRISEWLHWEVGELAIGVGLSRFFVRMAPNTAQETKDFIRKRGERALTALDRQLGQAKFLVGAAPTVADIAIFPCIATAEEGGFNIASYPNVQAWAERMLALPGVRHPYTIMPKEDRIAA